MAELAASPSGVFAALVVRGGGVLHSFRGQTQLVLLSAVMAMCSVGQAQYTGVDLYTMNAPGTLTHPSAGSFQSTDSGQVGGWAINGSNNNAVLWSSSGSATNLNPTNLTGFTNSVIQAINGGEQVGYAATVSNSSNNHAMLWNGPSDSAVDLHPTSSVGYTASEAFGTDGSNQVGFATYPASGGGYNHAMLWSGTAASTVDLQPTQFGSGYFASTAYGVAGSQQVGVMYGRNNDPGGVPHAVLWSGTAASAVDLNPTNLPTTSTVSSQANGIGGGEEVGYASFVNGTNAILWTGTAASAVDLNPTGSNDSIALATNGTYQVGYVSNLINGYPVNSAYVWSGTAASAVNLQALLPSNFGSSTAYSANSAGDVFGVAEDTSGNNHAVAWVAPPHTATASVSSGTNQMTTIAGRSPTSGQVDVTFPSASGGTLSNTNSLLTTSALASQTTSFNFALPTIGGLVQTWDLSFSGTFSGPASLTFHYDPSTLLPDTDPSQLEIQHFTNGQWVALIGTVNSTAETITVSTNSLSPFVLAEVPEPSTLTLVVVGGLALLVRLRSR
jgi:hypothetical protein